MKKWINGFLVITSIFFTKFFFTFVINEKIIADYYDEKYDSSLINFLYILNFNEPYIAYYNHGNILYQNKQYEEAIKQYETALKKKPPKDRVCDIQINLSLSIIATIEEEEKDSSLKKLEKAMNTLYYNHCADPKDSSGESKEAEQLEEEIKQKEKELENSNQEPNEKEPEEEEKEEERKEKDIEEQLKENRKNANENRQESLGQYENDSSSFYYGKTW